ncbi:hypothetical protein HGRIS_011483 [Hohenbuehelia grisea]|uniref:Uncharacterized protein n=1 Tax=Hohenbuehelia grisea TaxID=104357 RepID=A0ABR3JW19_9AGAR
MNTTAMESVFVQERHARSPSVLSELDLEARMEDALHVNLVSPKQFTRSANVRQAECDPLRTPAPRRLRSCARLQVGTSFEERQSLVEGLHLCRSVPHDHLAFHQLPAPRSIWDAR